MVKMKMDGEEEFVCTTIGTDLLVHLAEPNLSKLRL